MNRMHLATALLATVAAMSPVAYAVEIDGLAATVGTTPILRSDVENLMRRRGVTDASRFDEFRTELIDRTLILGAAETAKMSLQEWVVDDRVKNIIDNAFDGDRSKLIDLLAREKQSFVDWRQRIKEDLIVNAMRWNVVQKNVRASPAAMREEYAAHPERYRTDGSVTVSVILLKPEDVERRDDVDAMVKTNSFAAAARAFSADPHASEGGVWRDVNPSEAFRKEVCDEIAKIPAGKVSDWLDIGGWSFLLRKESESSSRQRTFAEAYDDVEAAVKEAEGRRMMDAWLERLREEAYIRVF